MPRKTGVKHGSVTHMGRARDWQKHEDRQNSEARRKQGGVSWFLSSQRTSSNIVALPAACTARRRTHIHDDEAISAGAV